MRGTHKLRTMIEEAMARAREQRDGRERRENEERERERAENERGMCAS